MDATKEQQTSQQPIPTSPESTPPTPAPTPVQPKPNKGLLLAAVALILLLLGSTAFLGYQAYQNRLFTQKISAVSRNRFIEAGLTEQYFDAHFKLKNTKSWTNSNGKYTYLYWTYTVGEYQTDVIDGIYYDRPNRPITIALHDIVTVIPFQLALDTLSSCFGERLTKEETSIEYDWHGNIRGNIQGLYLKVYKHVIEDDQAGFVVTIQTRVNLESGLCDPVSRNKIFFLD